MPGGGRWRGERAWVLILIGRLQAAVDGGRAPSLEFLLTRKKMLPSTREWAGRGAPGGPDGREFTVLSKTKKKHRI